MSALIEEAIITELPKSFRDPMPVVIVTFSDGTKKELFSFFSDEISFSADEFIGLTEQQARCLKREKDISYIQS